MKKIISIGVFLALIMLNLDAQRYRATVLKSICNSADWELAPVVYDNGIVYLSNAVIPSTRQFVNAEIGEPLTNIYFVPFDENNRAGKPEIFSDKILTNGTDGPVTFAQNDEMLCVCIQNGFAGKNLPKNGYSGLYFCYKSSSGEWGELIPFEQNDVNANYSTPYLTADGRTLYFAADNMDDSYGGWDIYVSQMTGRSWSRPRNLGSTINSEEWETFPYYHPSGRLYFSSNGHGSRGGSFDLFSSNFFNDEWSEPLAVPSLNTYNDEIALVINNDLSQGYFTRKVGKDFDIFRFQYPNYESFSNPSPIQKNRFCYRLRENSLDTIDYTMFYYEWVINDTLRIPGHDIKYCFPGAGSYNISFNVTNKVTDTIMYGVASLHLNLEYIPQPVITAPDTAFIGQPIDFNSDKTYWKEWPIEGFYWDFGNGVQEKGKSVRYQYTIPGEYTVVLGIKQKTRYRRIPPDKVSVYKNIVVLEKQ